MNGSLYDVLTRRLGDAPPADALVPSIVANLNRLFNSRRAAVGHLPGHGLPDISEVYRDMPESIAGLQAAIRDAVVRFEPRLRHVHVAHVTSDDYAMELEFLLTAELPDRQRVRFKTTFSSVEPAHTDPVPR